MSVSKEYLNSLFEYKDGELYWKAKRTGVTVGNKAGYDSGNGYVGVQINGKNHKLHRIIFMMHHGYLPKYIDHIDGNKSNNDISNLRECSHQENLFNVSLGKANKSGEKNVWWEEGRKRWRVCVVHKFGKFSKYVKDFELAQLLAIEARNKYHGEFANHGATL